MNEIIPGILEQEWVKIDKKLQSIMPFAKTAHIDIIDGKFGENKTFLDPKPFKKYSDNFLLELHMMVDNPIKYLKPWADAGFTRFIGHIEKIPDPKAFVEEAKRFGKVGIAIDEMTELNVLKTINLNDLDCVLVMTVTAGLSGQQFKPKLLKKVKELRTRFEFLQIEVDGGINNETILKAYSAGANRFVSTSYLFDSENIEKKFKKLTSLI